jgi:hypothetical protein
MIALLKTLSFAALAAILLAPFAYLAGWLAMSNLHHILLAATALWFACAPPWLWNGEK